MTTNNARALRRYRSTLAPAPPGLQPPRLQPMLRYGNHRLGRALSATRRFLSAQTFPLRLFLYSRSEMGNASLRVLSELKDSQLGETGVIVCNGPSLRETNLDLLQGLPYLLMNRGNLLGDRIAGSPEAVLAHDPKVLEAFVNEIATVDATMVTTVEGAQRTSRGEDLVGLRVSHKWRFATHLRLDSHHGGTVTFWALQLAFHLGWRKVLIIGMDHRYKGAGTPGSVQTAVGESGNHFAEGYIPAGTTVISGDMRANEYSYELARAAFEAHGREVVDCTEGGSCQVFRKSDLATEAIKREN